MRSAVRAGTECLKLPCFCVALYDSKSVLAPFIPAVYHAIYLEELTAAELTEKLAQLFNISPRQISQIFKQGPTGIHVLVSDEVRSGFSLPPPFTWLHESHDRC